MVALLINTVSILFCTAYSIFLLQRGREYCKLCSIVSIPIIKSCVSHFNPPSPLYSMALWKIISWPATSSSIISITSMTSSSKSASKPIEKDVRIRPSSIWHSSSHFNLYSGCLIICTALVLSLIFYNGYVIFFSLVWCGIKRAVSICVILSPQSFLS